MNQLWIIYSDEPTRGNLDEPALGIKPGLTNPGFFNLDETNLVYT